jgi:putative nucleotidyltransferase with HDIG domain
LISIINTKDRYTYGHIEQVVIYAKLISEELKLSKKDKRNLILGAYVHDIGKINISEQILVKKTDITVEEWEIIKKHPIDGEQIIRPITELNEVADIVLYHHERYDGTGYPKNLKGLDIPYLARVITVIDSFDAMTSERPYKSKLTVDQAIDELKKYSAVQFDPNIVDAFIRVINKQDNILQSMHLSKKGNG